MVPFKGRQENQRGHVNIGNLFIMKNRRRKKRFVPFSSSIYFFTIFYYLSSGLSLLSIMSVQLKSTIWVALKFYCM